MQVTGDDSHGKVGEIGDDSPDRAHTRTAVEQDRAIVAQHEIAVVELVVPRFTDGDGSIVDVFDSEPVVPPLDAVSESYWSDQRST